MAVYPNESDDKVYPKAKTKTKKKITMTGLKGQMMKKGMMPKS